MKLKKGDKVVIISGPDKGKQATIRAISNKSERVLLEGEGLKKVKKTHQTESSESGRWHYRTGQANPCIKHHVNGS